MILAWQIARDSPNLQNILPTKLSCYTISISKIHMHNAHLHMCVHLLISYVCYYKIAVLIIAMYIYLIIRKTIMLLCT